jgi:hypothetical protein
MKIIVITDASAVTGLEMVWRYGADPNLALTAPKNEVKPL